MPAINSVRPEHNGRHVTDKNLKYILFIENDHILTEISLKFVAMGLIINVSIG